MRRLAQKVLDAVPEADQDDVWNHDKIDVTLSAMLELEAKAGTTTALYLIDSQYWITFAVVEGAEGMPVGTIPTTCWP